MITMGCLISAPASDRTENHMQMHDSAVIIAENILIRTYTNFERFIMGYGGLPNMIVCTYNYSCNYAIMGCVAAPRPKGLKGEIDGSYL